MKEKKTSMGYKLKQKHSLINTLIINKKKVSIFLYFFLKGQRDEYIIAQAGLLASKKFNNDFRGFHNLQGLKITELLVGS